MATTEKDKIRAEIDLPKLKLNTSIKNKNDILWALKQEGHLSPKLRAQSSIKLPDASGVATLQGSTSATSTTSLHDHKHRQNSNRRQNSARSEGSRRSSARVSARRDTSIESRIIPGFVKELPHYSADSTYWENRHERDMDLDKIDRCPPTYCVTEDLGPLLTSKINASSRVLELGCGLAPLATFIKMRTNAEVVYCTDVSNFAIHTLEQKFSKLNPPVKFARLDVRSLQESTMELLKAEQSLEKKNERAHKRDRDKNELAHGITDPNNVVKLFDVVVSKGLVDCVCTAARSVQTLRAFFRAVHRILSKCGVYIFVTNVDPSLRTRYLDAEQWKFEVWPVPGDSGVNAIVCYSMR